MVKPVTLPCLQCFQTLLMYHKSNGRKTAPCPEYRISEFGRDSLNVSVALHALTDGLDGQCTNYNCAWKGKFEDAKAHDKTCPHRRINCTNNGCPATMERGQKDTHLAICKKQAVPCTECKRRNESSREISQHLHKINLPTGMWVELAVVCFQWCSTHTSRPCYFSSVTPVSHYPSSLESKFPR